MSEREQWGPWIDHDGNGCPCVGQYVRVVGHVGFGVEQEKEGIAGLKGSCSWDWRNAPHFARIVRYRIRKPRGLTVLEEALNQIPHPQPERVE